MESETVEVGVDAFRMIRLEKFLRKIDKHAVKIVENMEYYRLNHQQKQQQHDEEEEETAEEDGHSYDKNEYYGEANTTRRTMKLFKQLRAYQQGGVEWMLSLHQYGANGILADEMGLGKTLQVIAFLLGLYQEFGINGPHLIVGPMSVIGNWGAEIDKFANGLIDYHIHYGEKESREEELIRYMKRRRSNGCHSHRHSKKNDHSKQNHRPPISVIITSYELVIRDISMLKRLNSWKHHSSSSRSGSNSSSNESDGIQYLIVDEAHRIKNRQSTLYNKLLQLDVHHRMLLTGTPLQNNIQELWSLLSFILPGLFDANSDFQQWFNRPFEGDVLVSNGHESAMIEMKMDSNINNSTSHMMIPVTPASTSALTTMGSTPTSVNKKKKVVYRLLINDSVESSCTLSNEQRLSIIQALHRVLKPFFLRRVKSEVAIDLPSKVEKIIYCPMHPLQRLLHHLLRKMIEHQEQEKQFRKTQWGSIGTPNNTRRGGNGGGSGPSTPGLSGLRQLLRDQEDGSNEMQFKNLVMQLRKICNHPYLLLEDIHGIPDEQYFQYLLPSCGKLTVLNQLVNNLLVQSPGSKILIFSQMTSTLNIIEGLLHNQGILSFRLDGNTSKIDRDLNICKFSATSPMNSEDLEVAPRVFLLTTRAGGVGINLQAADTVIMYDSDWNPQQDLQAISRVHRIGQQRPVLVIRLLTSGPEPGSTSVEEYVWRRAQKKLEAGNEVLGRNVFDMGTTSTAQTDGEEKGDDKDTEEDDWTDLMNDLNSNIAPNSNSDVSLLSLFQASAHLSSNDSVNSLATTHSDDNSINSTVTGAAPYNRGVPMDIDFLDEGIMDILCRRDFPDKTVHTHRIPINVTHPQSVDEEQSLLSTWSQWLEHFKCGPSQETLMLSLLRPTMSDTLATNIDDTQPPVTTPSPIKSRRKSLMQMFAENDDVWLEQEPALQSPMGDLFKGSSATRKRKFSKAENSHRFLSPAKDSKGRKRHVKKLSEDGTSSEEGEDNQDLCCLCNEHLIPDEVIASIYEGLSYDAEVKEDIRNTFILCDGCDGSYHLICVGLHDVPADDWYCRYCLLTSSSVITKEALPPCVMNPTVLIM